MRVGRERTYCAPQEPLITASVSYGDSHEAAHVFMMSFRVRKGLLQAERGHRLPPSLTTPLTNIIKALQLYDLTLPTFKACTELVLRKIPEKISTYFTPVIKD